MMDERIEQQLVRKATFLTVCFMRCPGQSKNSFRRLSHRRHVLIFHSGCDELYILSIGLLQIVASLSDCSWQSCFRAAAFCQDVTCLFLKANNKNVEEGSEGHLQAPTHQNALKACICSLKQELSLVRGSWGRGCCVLAKKKGGGGGSAQSDHSTRCASIWRWRGWAQALVALPCHKQKVKQRKQSRTHQEPVTQQSVVYPPIGGLSPNQRTIIVQTI